MYTNAEFFEKYPWLFRWLKLSDVIKFVRHSRPEADDWKVARVSKMLYYDEGVESPDELAAQKWTLDDLFNDLEAQHAAPTDR